MKTYHQIISTFIIALLLHSLITGCNDTNRTNQKSLATDSAAIKELRSIHAVKDKKERIASTLKAMVKYSAGKDSIYAAYAATSISYEYYQVPDSMIYYSNLALAFYESHVECESDVVEQYANMGYCLLSFTSNVFKATYYLNKAATLYLKMKDEKKFPDDWVQRLFINVIHTNRSSRINSKALQYALITNEMTSKTADSLPMNHIASLTETASLYALMNNPDSGMYYVEKAAKFNSNRKQPVFETGVLDAKAECFFAKKMYDSSLQYYRQAIRLKRQQDFLFNLYKDYEQVLTIYTLLRKPAEAYLYSDSLQKAAGLTDSVQQMDVIKAQTGYHILYGNKDTASKFFNDYEKRIESFYDAERYKILSSIEAEYDLLDKQKAISKLSSEKKIAAEKLSQQNKLLILISVIAVLLITVFVLLLRQRRLQAKQHAMENEHKKTELEQRLLRTQMEPHFIFNTMAVLQGIVRSGDTQKASKYLNNFAKLLRISLENSRESLVPVHKEIEALDDYLSLQAMRFEDIITYTINLYNGYENDVALIPPMLLQPFVENAIQHGMHPGSNKLHIEINIQREDRSLLFTINDNGKGFNEEKNSTVSKQSLSIQITRERLSALAKQTGIHSDLQISNTGNGTLVKLIIPLVK